MVVTMSVSEQGVAQVRVRGSVVCAAWEVGGRYLMMVRGRGQKEV